MRICFLGDSFVNGTNDPHCLGWVGRVSARARHGGCDLTVYNLGIRRDTSSDVARRWQAETQARLPPGYPAMLVFSFGVNDCCDEDGRRRVSQADTLATARTMLTEAARRHPTLMIGPPPIADTAINERIATLSQALAELCRNVDVPYLHTYPTLAANAVWMHETAHGDGAHPGEGGYDALAELVAAWPSWQQAVSGG